MNDLPEQPDVQLPPVTNAMRIEVTPTEAITVYRDRRGDLVVTVERAGRPLGFVIAQAAEAIVGITGPDGRGTHTLGRVYETGKIAAAIHHPGDRAELVFLPEPQSQPPQPSQSSPFSQN